MASSSRWFYTLILIILTSALLVSCTRERAVPETGQAEEGDPVIVSGEASIVEPEVTLLPMETPTDTPADDPTATPTPQHETIAYTVQPGDTVSTIAEKHGTTSQRIREMNLLTTDSLLVGQMLRVPNNPDAQVAEAGTPTPTPGSYSYVIQAGDTLFSIAIEHGVNATDIVAANALQDPNNLLVGQTLIIPGYQPEEVVAASTAEVYQYVVQAGDTLGSIAMRFDVSSGVIVEANTLSNPDSLVVGQTLVIPGYQPPAPNDRAATGTAPSDDSAAIHVVQSGETLGTIAQKYGISAGEIATANNLTNPNLLQAGQQLRIPGVTAADVAAANQIVHTVQAGEGLNSIARQYGISVAAIVEANDIANPNLLTVGQRLIIPQE